MPINVVPGDYDKLAADIFICTQSHAVFSTKADDVTSLCGVLDKANIETIMTECPAIIIE